MKTLLWSLGLAAVAVALALFMGANASTVTLFWAPYRFDVSLNLALLVLLAMFVLLYLALRALAGLRQLPVRARQWRQQQTQRAVVDHLLDALTQQLAGRFVRAQASAQSALDHLRSTAAQRWPQRAHWTALAHLMLAEGAQSLRQTERRQTHLQAALAPDSGAGAELREGALLRAVRWAVEDRDLPAARQGLAELPQGVGRRIQALRLRLRVARLDGRPLEALETARLLSKHGAFSSLAARSLIRSLAEEALAAAGDLSQVRSVWRTLSSTEQAMPALALAAAARLGALSDAEAGPRAEQAWQWLQPLWARFDDLEPVEQHQMVCTVEALLPHLGGAGLATVEQAQRQFPDNVALLYLAGQACVQRQLWGKAAQCLGLARQRLSEPTLLRRTWVSLARLAEERGDPAAALEAWQQAARIEG